MNVYIMPPAHQQHVDAIEERTDEVDLARDLGASQNGEKRPRGIVERIAPARAAPSP
jgi:hypothetical protein